MQQSGMNKMQSSTMVNSHLCREQPDYVARITEDLGDARRMLQDAGVDQETVEKTIQAEQKSRWGGERR